jgi:serine/threonine-protein kinase
MPGFSAVCNDIVPHRGVLDSLRTQLGEVPRVSLRDTEYEESAAEGGEDSEQAGPWSVGRYQVHTLIGCGAMGDVFRGRDTDLGRVVALKALREEHRQDRKLAQRFVEEAQINGQLIHPGIVPTYELGTLADGRPFFTMKFVKGHRLYELLAERTSPAADLPRFLTIFEQICQTVAYAHSRGVIHRDLKPLNIMVGNFGEVQVMDWGLAKVLPKEEPVKDHATPPVNQTVVATSWKGHDRAKTLVGLPMGTPAYMAPEQARGETRVVDRRADVFSLGSILCEILTGTPAFEGSSLADLIYAAQCAQLAPAFARLDQCGADGELLTLARECLAAEPKNRPADAGVVAGRITAYLAGVQERLRDAELARAAETARAREAEAKASAERRSRRLTVALATTVLLAGGLGSAGWRWTENKRLERIRLASEKVNLALQEATRRRGLAQGAALGDIGSWELAAAAADQARDLLDPDVDPALRKQVEDLRVEVAAEREQAESDRTLTDRLVDIRSAEADDQGGWITDAAYAHAFREAGLDVATLTAEEASRKIRTRPPQVVLAVAAALDDWAAVRRDRKKDRAGATALSALAGAVDPDAWRPGLRRALDLPDRAARLEALQPLAKDAPFDTMGPVSLDLLGRALKDAGDPAGAEAVLRRAQQLHPGDVWTSYDLARTLERLAHRDEAIRYYTAARALRPETAHELAHALRDKGERDEEIAIFENLRRLRPGNGRHLGCLGRALLAKGLVEPARTVLAAAETANREAVRLRPDDASAHFSLGVALHIQGKLDQARVEYIDAIRLQPGNPAVHDNLSELLGRQGKVDEAIAEHRIAIRLQPDFANAYNTLGFLYRARLDGGAAAVQFRKAVQLQPDNAVYHDNLGQALQDQGKLDEAIREYREAYRLQPSLDDAHAGLGEIFEDQGKLEEAIGEYRAACQIQPRSDVAHGFLARALAGKANLNDAERKEALEHARRAVKLSPEDGDYQTALAMAEYRAGHWPESIAAAERSIALAKDDNATRGFFLAMALWRQGAKERSGPVFDQAVLAARKNDTGNARALAHWREAAELLGQPGPDRPPGELPPNPFEP